MARGNRYKLYIFSVKNTTQLVGLLFAFLHHIHSQRDMQAEVTRPLMRWKYRSISQKPVAHGRHVRRIFELAGSVWELLFLDEVLVFGFSKHTHGPWWLHYYRFCELLVIIEDVPEGKRVRYDVQRVEV